MNANVAYSGNDNFLVLRLVDHARLGLSPNIQAHEKNALEKIGDTGLWLWKTFQESHGTL